MEFFCHIESKNDELPQGKVSAIFNFCQVKWPKYRIFNTFQRSFSFYRPSVSQKTDSFSSKQVEIERKVHTFFRKSRGFSDDAPPFAAPAGRFWAKTSVRGAVTRPSFVPSRSKSCSTTPHSLPATNSRSYRKKKPKVPLLFPFSKQNLMKFAPRWDEPMHKNGQTADGHTGCRSAVWPLMDRSRRAVAAHCGGRHRHRATARGVA